MKDQDTLYSRWLTNDLSEQEIESLKASGEWEELERIIQATDKVSLPSFDKEAAFSQLSQRNRAKKKENARIFYILSSAAAIAILLFLAYPIWFSSSTLIQSEIGEQMVYTLPDQSKVTLNAASSIEFDAESFMEKRELQLTGEAFFEVEKGKSFMVNATNGKVEVLGTSFNIRTWGTSFHTTCYTGSVQVTKKDKIQVLSANEAATWDGRNLLKTEVLNVDPASWMKGTSSFINTSIRDVFEELERQYTVKVIGKDRNEQFSGDFTHDNLNLAIQQICGPSGLKWKQENPTTIVID